MPITIKDVKNHFAIRDITTKIIKNPNLTKNEMLEKYPAWAEFINDMPEDKEKSK